MEQPGREEQRHRHSPASGHTACTQLAWRAPHRARCPCSRALHTTRRRSEVGTTLSKVRRQSTHTHQTACPVPTPSGPSRGRPALLAQLLAPAFSDFLPLPSGRCFRVEKKRNLSTLVSRAEHELRGPKSGGRRRGRRRGGGKGGRGRARPQLGVSRSHSCVCVASRWCGCWTPLESPCFIHCLREGLGLVVQQAPFRHRGPGLVVVGLPRPAQQGTGPGGCFFTGRLA